MYFGNNTVIASEEGLTTTTYVECTITNTTVCSLSVYLQT